MIPHSQAFAATRTNVQASDSVHALRYSDSQRRVSISASSFVERGRYEMRIERFMNAELARQNQAASESYVAVS